ncbi:MAG: aminotransferase [Myxococcales bacterium]|nr:aminotransferase [Myxococcales bacterium]
MPPIPHRAVVALQNPGTEDFCIVPPQEATVSAFDRSFHFGDSLYEVVRTYAGIPFALADHLARLKASARHADFGALPADDLLLDMVRRSARAFFAQFGNVDVYIRVTVSRGVGDVSIDRRDSGPAYAVVVVKDVPQRPDGIGGPGVHWALVARRRNAPEALDPAMKSGNYLNNVLALAEAQAAGAEDALLLDVHGFATEGTTSNFFAVVDGRVQTAPSDAGILIGVTRAFVLRACVALGVPVDERRFGPDVLWSADELFLSSSTREVQAITRLSGRAIGTGEPGPVTCRVHGEVRAAIARWMAQQHNASLFG